MDAISVDAPMCPVPRHREAGRDIICLRDYDSRNTLNSWKYTRADSVLPRVPPALFQGYSHRQLLHLSRDISKEYSKKIFTIFGDDDYPETFRLPILSVSVWKVAKFLILVEDSDFVTNVINVGKGMRHTWLPSFPTFLYLSNWMRSYDIHGAVVKRKENGKFQRTR